MLKLLRSVLRFGWRPALKDKTLFNGQLLDQNREDVYVVLHQMGASSAEAGALFLNLPRCSRERKYPGGPDGNDPYPCSKAHAATRGLFVCRSGCMRDCGSAAATVSSGDAGDNAAGAPKENASGHPEP